MLSSARGAVVGASDVARTVDFCSLFDLVASTRGVLPAAAAEALYGVSSPLEEVLLGAPGSQHGTVRVLGSVASAPAAGHYATGSHAFDLYTRDMEASLERAREAGWRVGPVGHVELGPLVMDQATVTGPDDLLVVLIASERRRPSLLDTDPAALHSEGHSLVWAVEAMDEAVPFWSAAPGLTVPFVAPVVHPEVNRFMELPDREAGLRMAMVCDAQVTPMRFELLEFVGKHGGRRADWPLLAGLHAPAFVVDDLVATQAAMLHAEFGPVVELDTPAHPSARACTALAPGGVRFELWQESA